MNGETSFRRESRREIQTAIASYCGRAGRPRAIHNHRTCARGGGRSEFSPGRATQSVPISAEADWTCRVLVGGLKPARVYWYRFTDSNGNGSRIGRTRTAPDDAVSQPVPPSSAAFALLGWGATAQSVAGNGSPGA